MFAPKLILTETLVILPQSLQHIILSLGLEIHSFAQKTDAFCIKMLFFTKRKQRHQKLTLSKPENISSRKLNISIKNFLKMVTICYKNEKILQNWCFCKIFDFTRNAHITKKLTLLTKIAIFSELTTNILLNPIVIFPKIDN